MIASFSSRVVPPPNPSAVSASPSSCNAPVTQPGGDEAEQRRRRIVQAEQRSPASAPRRRCKPIPAPTSGNAQHEAATAPSAARLRLPGATGSRVSTVVAVRNCAKMPESLIHRRDHSGFSW